MFQKKTKICIKKEKLIMDLGGRIVLCKMHMAGPSD